MSAIKTIHVHSGSMYGGVERAIVALAERADLAPDIAFRFALTVPGRLSDELARAGAAPSIIGGARASRPWSVAAAQAQLRTLLRREPCDVAMMHSLWSLALFGRTVVSSGARLVLWVHGAAPSPWWETAWARRTTPRHVIANSHYTAGHLPSFLAGIPCDVIHPPLARHAPAPDAREQLRRTTAGGVAPDDLVLIQVARLEEAKGHRVLLDAVSGLAGPWKLWIAGRAALRHELEYERAIRWQAKRLGLEDRVAFLGEHTDIPSLLAAADIYVQPNTAPEAYGLALIEALLAGRPAVASDSGATRELAPPGAAVLVPPGDPVALRAALQRLIDDPAARNSLGSAGPAAAAQLADPATVIPQLAGVIRRATA